MWQKFKNLVKRFLPESFLHRIRLFRQQFKNVVKRFLPEILLYRIYLHRQQLINRGRPRYYGDGAGRAEPFEESLKVRESRNKNNYAVIWAPTANLGDDMQTLAAINLLKKNGINDFTFINREKLSLYEGPPINLIMNGWFLHDERAFPPSPKIKPFFIGFHCQLRWLIRQHAIYFKRHAPIGCRDLNTMRICQEFGIDAYFSGCLTLTLDEMASKNDEICLVDVVAPLPNYIPACDVDLTEITDGQIIFHEAMDKSIRDKPMERMKKTEKLLSRYGKAKLVVTSRLHCALPCRALNTDVIFIHKQYATDPRFMGLEKYLNGYDGGTPGSRLDMSYKSIERAIIHERKQKIMDAFADGLCMGADNKLKIAGAKKDQVSTG